MNKESKKGKFNRLIKDKNQEEVDGSVKKNKINYNLLLIITFFTGVLLIISSYAWFYTSLDVKVDFFKMVVSNQTGLFISLDGIEFGSTVEISKDILMDNLKKTYPNHTNQWASSGLYSVSTNGVRDNNSNTFSVYGSSRLGYELNSDNERMVLNTTLINEEKTNPENVYIAFDIFLKNVSGSPKSDNVYLNEGTSIILTRGDDSDGTINSMRLGFLRMGTVSSKSDLATIQALDCLNVCESVIYEPNSYNHSDPSIERAKEYNVTLLNGTYNPTYAVINEGKYMELANGQAGSGIPLDIDHFAIQSTITSFNRALFQVPNGITKVRVYLWIEGQDMDSLESFSKGISISVTINLIKDLAGYY